MREDYSAGGTAWDSFPHDHARSRAYRWGEDGILGISDNHQRLCFALALWNERDPILKERYFGLTGSQGNHREDVKEYYFYLDATPTHSYMRGLYKYPQTAYPYGRLVEENGRRGRRDPELELLQTGAFDESRYWDVAVEYAKADTDDILIRITASNRGPEAAPLHLLPTLWFRNTWSWKDGIGRPRLSRGATSPVPAILAQHYEMDGVHRLHCEGQPDLYFTENESNARRLWGADNASPYVMRWFLDNRADLAHLVTRQVGADGTERRLLSLVSGARLQRVLRYMLDEGEFLSPHGIRALSRHHADHPYVMHVNGQEHRVDYEPAESSTGLFGGNSNWRGPIWFPMNFLIIESLQRFDHFFRGELKVEMPTGSGQSMALWDVAGELSRRLTRIFLVGPDGRRPVHGGFEVFQADPHWRDLILFYEYFHGDNGAGIGASHQTGWTGLVAKLLQQSGE